MQESIKSDKSRLKPNKSIANTFRMHASETKAQKETEQNKSERLIRRFLPIIINFRLIKDIDSETTTPRQ